MRMQLCHGPGIVKSQPAAHKPPWVCHEQAYQGADKRACRTGTLHSRAGGYLTLPISDRTQIQSHLLSKHFHKASDPFERGLHDEMWYLKQLFRRGAPLMTLMADNDSQIQSQREFSSAASTEYAVRRAIGEYSTVLRKPRSNFKLGFTWVRTGYLMLAPTSQILKQHIAPPEVCDVAVLLSSAAGRQHCLTWQGLVLCTR